MSFTKCCGLLLLVCCLAAFVVASPRPEPQHGSVVVSATQDQAGRQAGVQYNHNLFTSRDGRGSIDAYANANRNFDHNRNDFNGGVQGRWRF